jgi:hypothetical protein
MPKTEKLSLKSTVYIDIKLEGLREILKVVLKHIEWISLGGDKSTVNTTIHDTFRIFTANIRTRSSKTCFSTTFLSSKHIKLTWQSRMQITKVSKVLTY